MKQLGQYDFIKNFGPQWFSAVMGTGALSISMSVSSEHFAPFLFLSQFFLLFSIGMFIVFIIPWVIRFFTNFNNVKKDLFHPVLGNFFPTMPISLVVIGIAIERVGPSMFDVSVVNTISLYLFLIGSIGIFIFGWIILSIIFTNKKIKLEHANYGWFIPPVSHLIIPVLGFSLMKHYTDPAVDNVLFFMSMIGFGIGVLLFLFVGSIVYHRYIYHELPPSKLAPTFLIGIAPTSIITIILVKLMGGLSGFSLLGIDPSSISAEIKLISVMTWGFSLWWFVLFLFLFLYYVKKKDHPFVFGWWAYTFPFGAFVISNGAIANIIDFSFFNYMLQIGNILLLLLWSVVFYLTLKQVIKGDAFKSHDD